MLRSFFASAIIAVVCGMLWLAPESLSAPPRTKDTAGMMSEGDGPQFRCQLGQRLGSEADSLRLIAAVSIPYDNLIFLRSDSGFSASFELVTTVLHKDGKLYDERITSHTVDAATFVETNSRIHNAAHVEEFLVPPGEYRVRVTLTADKESRRRSKWEGSITLSPSNPLLRLSDIYWVTEDVNLTEMGVPRLVESFSTAEDSAQARAQIFSSGSQKISLSWILLNEAGDTVRKTDESIVPNGQIQNLHYLLRISGLISQQFTLKLVAMGNGRTETRERQFHVRIPGIPVSIRDLDLAIRQLRYIASGAEYNKLRQATGPERERLFKEFWKRRDPTPGTDENELMDEYYRRVEYSNEKFATNRPGWESDRGRIYILYGEPTDIERHPFEANSRPYEIWYYSSIARRFVFVDYTGFGDYSLATPEWGY
jgi:GWxTD domain-containing protein